MLVVYRRPWPLSFGARFATRSLATGTVASGREDRQFRIPAIRLAEARSAPTFLYAFDWRSPLFEGEMGSCHSLEVPFVLGQTGGPFGEVFVGGGPEAELLSRRMIDAWAAFARSGDPSCDALGSWAVYGPGRATMNLSRTPGLAQAPNEERRAAWDGLI